MARTLPLFASRALMAGQTDEAFLLLLTISHADLATPIRVSSDAVNTVSNGETFIPFPFSLSLPDEVTDSPPSVRLSIDNVDRTIMGTIREIDTPLSIRLEVVAASSPDDVLAGPFDFSLRQADGDAASISGELRFEDVLNEPSPAGKFTPAVAPGLF